MFRQILFITSYTSAIGTVAGGLSGGSLSNAQIAGVLGQNAVENNFFAESLSQQKDRQAFENNTKKIYGWTDKQLEEYSKAKDLAALKGIKEGAIDTLKSIKQLVTHPIDSIVGVYDIITNPTQVYNTIKISTKEWTELYNYALKTNPSLAGEMEGYMVGKSVVNLNSGLIISGSAVQVVSKVAKLKYADKVKNIKGTDVNKPLGLGSTGRNTPANLNEKLALEQAISNPNAGRQLPVPMTDKRWPASDGWVKMSQNINGIEVHYVRNVKTGAIDHFKFK